MQSDAFPTPPIYAHQFQPRLGLQSVPPQDDDHHLTSLLDEIELLMKDCSAAESQSFWLATTRIKIRHQVIASMQKIESLFLDLAIESTQDPDLIEAISTGLLYTNHAQSNYAPIPLEPPRLLEKLLEREAC
jgi:hypothetical protein